MVYIKAQSGPPNVGDSQKQFTVHYFDECGNLVIRSGGTRSWRCNNPGNLQKSPYSMSPKRGAIGYAGDGKDYYAVYPDKETGREALIVMLKGNIYAPLSIRKALERYEPHLKNYAHIVSARTGLDPERTIRSLSNREFTSFLDAIEFVENWTVGREDFIEKWIISGVRKKRGIVFEYCLMRRNQKFWISKDEAINLAKEGIVRANLVRPSKRNMYLRPLRGTPAFPVIT